MKPLWDIPSWSFTYKKGAPQVASHSFFKCPPKCPRKPTCSAVSASAASSCCCPPPPELLNPFSIFHLNASNFSVNFEIPLEMSKPYGTPFNLQFTNFSPIQKNPPKKDHEIITTLLLPKIVFFNIPPGPFQPCPACHAWHVA